MTPLYSHRQIAWPTVIGAGVGGIVLVAGALVAQLGAALPLALVVIPAIVLLCFGSLTVRVYQDHIRVHFGVGAPRFTIDMRDVRSYRVVRNPWFYGWGIRLVPGGVMYNASGFDAIELRLDGGRVVRIGTDEPQALAAALAHLLPEDGFNRQPEPGAAVQPWLALVIPILFFTTGMIIATSVTCGRAQAAGQVSIAPTVTIIGASPTLPLEKITPHGYTSSLAQTTGFDQPLRVVPGRGVVSGIRAADAVVRLTIVANVGTVLVGDGHSHPRTEYRARVVDVIVDRARLARAGGEVRLYQDYAGSVVAAGRDYRAMEPLFSVGSEIIVLAERVAGGALMSLAGPMFELRVSGGSVRIAANVAKETFVDGMTVEAFATAARAVLASEGPLRIGPTSERLRAEDVAAIDAAIGKRAAWLLQGFPPSYDASNSSWYVSAYLPADHVTARLRRGTIARVLGAMVSREAYDQRKKWTLTTPQAYAQVLEPGNDDPLAIAGPRDRQRPFRVYGEFTDDDLLAIVDLIRSAPTLPSKTGEPPQSVIFHHVRGSWPIQTISADEIGITVTLLDESPAEKTGQGVHLQKADGKWTVIRLTAWIAD